MKWFPRWIGISYSKLWVEFRENTFDFDDAKRELGKLALNYLSELRKYQVLYIFDKKGRKRIYRGP